ncbi:hypothetical protein QCA50_001170 [Cerrena zonata]|uniref:Uncharacterized protein n=1 Tax=Cerrena zonata TaxID=2478898 RepID=A0AAW0GW51_9APHY
MPKFEQDLGFVLLSQTQYSFRTSKRILRRPVHIVSLASILLKTIKNKTKLVEVLPYESRGIEILPSRNGPHPFLTHDYSRVSWVASSQGSSYISPGPWHYVKQFYDEENNGFGRDQRGFCGLHSKFAKHPEEDRYYLAAGWMEVTGYGKNAISMEQGLTLSLTQESTECPIYLVHISQIEEVLASRKLAEEGNFLIERARCRKSQ